LVGIVDHQYVGRTKYLLELLRDRTTTNAQTDTDSAIRAPSRALTIIVQAVGTKISNRWGKRIEALKICPA
jgi:ribosomal protein S19